MTFFDLAYWVGLVAGAPYWLAVPKVRRKVFKAFRDGRQRTHAGPISTPVGRVIMIHAVSLGEMNATCAMLELLAIALPDASFVVTVTSDTGYARGKVLDESDPRVRVIRFPLDFSTPVRRLLDTCRPVVVVLMELEVWPNFILHCHRRGIPVLIVNGRLTSSSFRNYRLVRRLMMPTFGRLGGVCAQDRVYAERFIKRERGPGRAYHWHHEV